MKKFLKAIFPTQINGIPIKFVLAAEHVGVLQCPHIHEGIKAHSVVFPARNQIADPAVSVSILAIHS